LLHESCEQPTQPLACDGTRIATLKRGHREIRMNAKLPAKPPKVGQRTYVGMAQWYLEAALRELGPNARHQLYIDLRKLLDRLERKDRSEAA
jgi:hypothetical protein